MISIFLSQSEMRFVVADKKSRRIRVKEYGARPESYLALLSDPARISVSDLTTLFIDLKEMVSTKGETVSIVLPDHLFEMIDCFPLGDMDITEYVEQTLERPLAEFYFSTPIIVQPQPLEKDVTACAIDRRIVDALIDAAEQCEIQLESIEAASIAALRASEQIIKEELLFFQEKEKATLLAFSGIGGLFKMDVPQLSRKALGIMTEEAAESQITESILKLEQIALQTFTYFNKDVPIIIYSEEPWPFRIMAQRISTSCVFPEYIKNDVIPETDQIYFLPCIGTLLQTTGREFLDITDETFTFESGNVLPERLKRQVQSFRFVQKLQKLILVGIFLCFFIGALEFLGILFFSNTEVPDALREEYDTAQKSMPILDKELSIIALYEKENQNPLIAYQGIMMARPEGVGFTSVEIGGVKNANADWIKIRVVAKDPVLFQDYATMLTRTPLFPNVVIQAIHSDSSGYKTADLAIKKGGIAK